MSASDEISDAPVAGEAIHLPSPSITPLLNAVGISLALIGLTLSWWLVGVGALVFLATTVRWIRDVARDVDELPLDHAAH